MPRRAEEKYLNVPLKRSSRNIQEKCLEKLNSMLQEWQTGMIQKEPIARVLQTHQFEVSIEIYFKGIWIGRYAEKLNLKKLMKKIVV